jgi:transposase-like protein
MTASVRSPHRCATLLVITLAVRWYLRFGLSYRDVEELLGERGIPVDHVTIYRWVQRFAPEFAQAARARRHLVGDRWHVDKTYLKVGGTWRYLFRAIDQFGQVIDVFLSPRRNTEAARRLFSGAITRTRVSPTEVTTARYRVVRTIRWRPTSEGDRRRARLRPEPPPGLLRPRDRCPTDSSSRRRVRGTGPRDLNTCRDG